MLTARACPVGQRRSRNDDGAEQFGPNGRQHHDSPAGLAIPDHAWLSVRPGMQIDDLLKEDRFSACDVFNGLAGHRLRQKADEVARMPSSERDADLAVDLESANAGAMAGTRIDNDKRPTCQADLNLGRGDNPGERVVDRALKTPAVNDQLRIVVEHVRNGLTQVRAILIAALAHHVEVQQASLRGVDHVLDSRRQHAEWRCDRIARRLVDCHSSLSFTTVAPAYPHVRAHSATKCRRGYLSIPFERYADIAGNAAAEIDDLDTQLVAKRA